MSIKLDFNTLINDRYQPVEWLEAGGMSLVLKARQINVNQRLVALKFLTWQKTENQEERRRRYEQEMVAMADLPHYRIVPLYDFEWYGDVPFLVMEFMSGGSLQKYLHRLYHDRQKAFRLLKTVCEAVDYIHNKGIIHCDLKPSNILFDESEEPRISDFGIARLPDTQYIPPEFVGTPGYMPPEQENNDSDIDHRADIFALGVIAWQLFTGQHPPEPQNIPPGELSEGLRQTLCKALSIEREKRYNSASEFLNAVKPFISKEEFGALVSQVPLSYRNNIRQIIEDYTAVFGGRDVEMTIFDEWLEEDHRPFALLQTPAGQGKTALLINWALDVQLRGEWQTIFHPISLRYGTAVTNSPTVYCLAEALSPLFDEELLRQNMSPEIIRPQIIEWLRRDLPENKKLLIIIDGLDEAQGWDISNLIPNRLGQGIKLLVSARSLGGRLPQSWLARLKWEQTTTHVFDGLAGLQQDALRELLRHLSDGELNDLADNKDFLNEFERVSEGDPLTVRVVVDALCIGEMSPKSLSQRPSGLTALLESWLEQLNHQIHQSEVEANHRKAAKHLLGICSVALGPLTNEDISELLPHTFEDIFDIQQAIKIISRFIIGNGEPDSGYVFSHPHLRDFFAEKLFPRQKTQYQQTFINYGQRIFDKLPETSYPAYLRKFWIAHLAENQEWKNLKTSLLKRNEISGKYMWAEMRFAVEGSYSGFLSDLDKLWRNSEETGDIVTQLECALIHSTIHTLSSKIPPELLIHLVLVGTPDGKWPVAAALEYIKQMPDEQQAKTLELMVTQINDLPFSDIFEIARSVDKNARYQPEIKCDDEDDDTDDKSETLLSISLRANTLMTLAPHFSSSLRRKALKEAILAQSYQPEMCQPSSLAKIVSNLSKFSDDIREEIIADALKIAQSLEEEAYRIYAIIKLIPYLPQHQQYEIVQQILVFVESLDDENGANLKVQTLIDLAPYLPQELKVELMWETIATIPMMTDTIGMKSDILKRLALVDVAPYLPELATIRALELAREIEGFGNRLEALCGVIPYLPEEFKREFLENLLKELMTIENEEWRSDILIHLVPHLPKNLIEGAIDVLQIQPQHFSTWLSTLEDIAQYLPDPKKRKIIEEEWEFALTQNYFFDEDRSEVLISLVPHLPNEIIQKDLSKIILNLQKILEIDNKYTFSNPRLEVLKRIGKHLNSDYSAQIFDIIKTLKSEWAQMEALSAIISELSAETFKDFSATLISDAQFMEKLLTVGEALEYQEKKEVLHRLVPYLPRQLKLEAEKAIKEIEEFALQQEPSIYHSDKNVLQVALGKTQKICDILAQVRTIAALLPYIHKNRIFVEKALSAAQMITENRIQAEAFICLTPYLPHETRMNVLKQTLAIAKQLPGNSDDDSIIDRPNDIESPRMKILNDLIPYLPDVLLIEILDEVQDFTENHDRERLLIKLTQYLSKDKLGRIVSIVPTIEETKAQVDILIAVAQRLSGEQKEAIFQKAIESTKDCQDVQDYIKLSPHLPKKEQQQLSVKLNEQAEKLIEQAKITRMPYQVRLWDVLDYLPRELVQQALQSTREIIGDAVINGIFTAPFIPRLAQLGLFDDALKEAQEIYDEKILADLWLTVAPHLPTNYKMKVLELIRKRIEYCRPGLDSERLIELLRGLAGLWIHLPETLKPEVLQEIVEFGITSEELHLETFKILMTELVSSDYIEKLLLQKIWQSTLHKSSQLKRHDFLLNLRVFIPLALHLSDENRADDIYYTMQNVTQAWP